MRFSLAATARQSAVIRQDLYSNPYLGLAFSKPGQWRFRPESELHTLANSQKLTIDDEDVVDEVWMEIGLPLVSITSTATDETAPEADVWVDVNEGGDWDVVRSQEEGFAEFYLPLLKGLSFETYPTAFTFGGHSASRCTSRFVYEGIDGDSDLVRVKSILCPVGDVVFSINLKSSLRFWNTALDEIYGEFLDSFKFGEPPG